MYFEVFVQIFFEIESLVAHGAGEWGLWVCVSFYMIIIFHFGLIPPGALWVNTIEEFF